MSKELTESEPGYFHPDEVRVQAAGVWGEGRSPVVVWPVRSP